MAGAVDILEKVKPEVNGIVEISEDGNDILASKENVINLLRILKEKHEYVMLADLTCADYEDRFEVIYHLMKLNAEVIKVKIKLSKEAPKVSTAKLLWKAADVQEREIFDLMGIQFEGHDNLTRILLPDDFEGHPLRKDFKIEAVSRF